MVPRNWNRCRELSDQLVSAPSICWPAFVNCLPLSSQIYFFLINAPLHIGQAVFSSVLPGFGATTRLHGQRQNFLPKLIGLTIFASTITFGGSPESS